MRRPMLRRLAQSLGGLLALAAANKASARLVIRDGRVVVRRFWRGHRPDGWINSASTATTVTAFLIGIAVGEGRIAEVRSPSDHEPSSP